MPSRHTALQGEPYADPVVIGLSADISQHVPVKRGPVRLPCTVSTMMRPPGRFAVCLRGSGVKFVSQLHWGLCMRFRPKGCLSQIPG